MADLWGGDTGVRICVIGITVQGRGFFTSCVLSFAYLMMVCLGVFPQTRPDDPELQPISLFVNDFPVEVLRLSLDLQTKPQDTTKKQIEFRWVLLLCFHARCSKVHTGTGEHFHRD